MKALACDFDGTLFFSDNSPEISFTDIDAIKSFQSKGNLFGFCTGRTIEGILEHTDGLLQADFYITNSGACILNKDFDVLFEKIIPKTIFILFLHITSNRGFYRCNSQAGLSIF